MFNIDPYTIYTVQKLFFSLAKPLLNEEEKLNVIFFTFDNNTQTKITYSVDMYTLKPLQNSHMEKSSFISSQFCDISLQEVADMLDRDGASVCMWPCAMWQCKSKHC